MLHLDYYGTLVPEGAGEAAQGNRLIAKVRRVRWGDGSFRHLIRPIDCLNEESISRSINLFRDYTMNFRIPSNEEEAAERACESVIGDGWGDKVISCQYRIAENPTVSPLSFSDVRCLECTRNDMKERITGLVNEKTKLTSGLDQLKRDIEEKEKEREQLEEAKAQLAEIQERQRQTAERMKQIVEAAKELNTRAWSYANELSAFGIVLDLKALGLDPLVTETPPQAEQEPVPNLRSFAGQVREALTKEDGLDYEPHVIREFLGAMRTNQIIILSGPPGTGKSSLPQAIAKYIHAKCRMVSVQPSWTDNQDLLGFYDPTRGRFVATPFMDILVEAGQDPSAQYLVCLDEMNLVRVEYYFSELLSVMEINDPDRRKLRLYSPFDHQRRKEDCKKRFAALTERVRQGDQDAVNACSAAAAELAALNRYPAEFPIPGNVHFVGTLNMDESTKELSPKVLDRSFIIDIRRADGTVENEPSPELPEQQKTLLHNLQGILTGLENKDPHQIRAALSSRGMDRAKELLDQGLDMDDIFLGKILPAMKYTGLEPDELNKLVHELEPYRAHLKKGLDKLGSIYDKELKELNYWG